MKLFFITTLLLFIFTPQAHASELEIELSPSIVKLQLMPGEKTQYTLTLSNNSPQKITLTPSFYKSEPDTSGKGTMSLPSTKTLKNTHPEAASYFSLKQNSKSVENIELESGESKKIILSVQIPVNTAMRDIYSTLVFTTKNSEGGGSTISAGIASNIFLTVGQSVPELSIEEFSTQRFYTNGKVPFKLSLRNSGKNYTTALAKIEIFNMFGNKVETITTEPVFLPENSKRIISQDPELKWESPLSFGYYKAVSSINGQNTSNKQVSFLILPTVPLVIIIICLTFIIGVYLRVRKKI